MAWIRNIPVNTAEADGGHNPAASPGRKPLANILAVHGARPRVLHAHVQLYREIMFGESELSRAERETVAVAVSKANDCFY